MGFGKSNQRTRFGMSRRLSWVGGALRRDFAVDSGEIFGARRAGLGKNCLYPGEFREAIFCISVLITISCGSFRGVARALLSAAGPRVCP